MDWSTVSPWIVRSYFVPQAPNSMITGMTMRAPIRRKEEREGILISEVYERARANPSRQSLPQWGILPVRPGARALRGASGRRVRRGSAGEEDDAGAIAAGASRPICAEDPYRFRRLRPFPFGPDRPFERDEAPEPDELFERGGFPEPDRPFDPDGARRRRRAATPIPMPMPAATTPPIIHAEKRSQTLRPALLVA